MHFTFVEVSFRVSLTGLFISTYSPFPILAMSTSVGDESSDSNQSPAIYCSVPSRVDNSCLQCFPPVLFREDLLNFWMCRENFMSKKNLLSLLRISENIYIFIYLKQVIYYDDIFNKIEFAIIIQSHYKTVFYERNLGFFDN